MDVPGTADCLYSVLGVPKDAPASDIKLAYRRLALQHHPDKAGPDKDAATALFAKISRAYATLSDAAKRQYYDETGTDDGMEMSAEEFLAQFSALMHECTGGMSIQQLVAGMSAKDIAAMPPFPFPRELFPPGTFPEGMRFSEQGLQGMPPAVQELLASGDAAALQQLVAASAATAAQATTMAHADWLEASMDPELMEDPALFLQQLPPELLRVIEAGDAAGAAAFLAHLPQGASCNDPQQQQQQQLIQDLLQQLAAMGPITAGTGCHNTDDDSSSDPDWEWVRQGVDTGNGAADQCVSDACRHLDQHTDSQPRSSGIKAADTIASRRVAHNSDVQRPCDAAAGSISRAQSLCWMEAAKAGDVQQLRRLLAATPQLLHHQSGALRSSALHWVASKGHIKALQALLQLGADPALLNAVGSNPLHAACAGGHAECVQALLATGHAAPDLRNEEGLTPADLARQHGHADCQQLAVVAAASAATPAAGPAATAAAPGECTSGLSMGTNVHTTSSPTASTQAASRSGADEPDSLPVPGSSAAQQNGSHHMASGGAPAGHTTHTGCSSSGGQHQSGFITSADGSGSEAVHFPPCAAQCKPASGAEVGAPADVFRNSLQATTTAETVISSAAGPVTSTSHTAGQQQASPSVTDAAAQTPDTGPSVAATASTSAPSNTATTISRDVGRAWLDAAKAGTLSVLQSLLEQSPNRQSLLQYTGKGTSYGFVGNSALHWAAAKGHVACVRWLLEQGAIATELRNSGGSTALHSAAANSQVDCARALMLEGGADMLAQDELGDSARTVAEARSYSDVVVAMDTCHAALLLLSSARNSWTARTMLAFLRLAGLKAEASRCIERQELVDAVERALQRFDGAHKGAAIRVGGVPG